MRKFFLTVRQARRCKDRNEENEIQLSGLIEIDHRCRLSSLPANLKVGLFEI